MRPKGVPSVRACRNISPVETHGMPRCSDSRDACVPLPAPWRPTTRMITRSAAWSSEEALVVPHHELALDLLHRFEGDTHHDEDGGAPEGELPDPPQRDHHRRDDGDQAEIQRPGQRDTGEDLVEVLGRGIAGPVPRDEPALLLDQVGLALGVELDGRVEVAEEDDEDEVDRDVPEA